MHRTKVQNGRPLMTLIFMALLALTSGAAHAVDAANPQIAAAAQVSATGALKVAGACDGAIVVLSVQNTASRWSGVGRVRIHDATTGRVVRERQLVMGANQMASFRVPDDEVEGRRYQVSVHMADGQATYVKSFSGRCSAPKTDLRTAQR